MIAALVATALAASLTVNKLGYETATLNEGDEITFSGLQNFQSFVIFDMNVASALRITNAAGEIANFESTQLYGFSVTEQVTITSKKELPVNVSIYTVAAGVCSGASQFVTGQPRVSFSDSVSNNMCVFSPTSHFLETVRVSSGASVYEAPFDSSSVRSCGSSECDFFVRNPYFVKYSASANASFSKSHSGGTEWSWNVCARRHFGGVDSDGVSEPAAEESSPHCWRPSREMGLTSAKKEFIGSVVPVTVLGLVLPIMAINGFFNKWMKYEQVTEYEDLEKNRGMDDQYIGSMQTVERESSMK